VVEHGRSGPLEWAVTGESLPGESVSGDHWIVVDAQVSVLLGVIDGLGHGRQAAVAARRAAEVLTDNAAEPLDALFVLCHQALSSTRGAAITLVSIDVADGSLRWLGVGNVVASLVRAAPGRPRLQASALLRGGVVGHQLPSPLRPTATKMKRGDVLLVGTDGLDAKFDENPDLAQPAVKLARDILSRCSKGIDDALLLVARYRGSVAV
jgi:phosphoserine phosphatase RsbX